MAQLYTESYFRNLASQQRITLNKSLDTILLESNQAYTQFDIFLSHSYLDKEVITGVGIELGKMGYKVYIDWVIDQDLSRRQVNKQSVETLRKRISSCKCLYYATSSNSSSSKWMPWELGFMDGKKDKCAILPINTSGYTKQTFQGQEYLSVYPYVVKELSDKNVNVLWIVETPTKYIDFDSWLIGRKPYERNSRI